MLTSLEFASLGQVQDGIQGKVQQEDWKSERFDLEYRKDLLYSGNAWLHRWWILRLKAPVTLHLIEREGKSKSKTCKTRPCPWSCWTANLAYIILVQQRLTLQFRDFYQFFEGFGFREFGLGFGLGKLDVRKEEIKITRKKLDQVNRENLLFEFQSFCFIPIYYVDGGKKRLLRWRWNWRSVPEEKKKRENIRRKKISFFWRRRKTEKEKKENIWRRFL